MIAHKGVIDLFQFGIALGVTVCGISNRSRMRGDGSVVECVAEYLPLRVLEFCLMTPTEEGVKVPGRNGTKKLTDALVAHRSGTFQVNGLPPRFK